MTSIMTHDAATIEVKRTTLPNRNYETISIEIRDADGRMLIDMSVFGVNEQKLTLEVKDA